MFTKTAFIWLENASKNSSIIEFKYKNAIVKIKCFLNI